MLGFRLKLARALKPARAVDGTLNDKTLRILMMYIISDMPNIWETQNSRFQKDQNMRTILGVECEYSIV